MSWREDIVASARTWLHTPYHHRAHIKGVGVDCGWLLFEVYNPVMHYKLAALPNNYSHDWCAHKGSEDFYLNFIKPYVVEVKALQPGGFSVFKWGRFYGHGAIWTGSSYIHAYGRGTQGSVREDRPQYFRTREVKHFDPVEALWNV